MKKYLFLFFILILASFQVKSQSKSKHILVVHGGAGNISKEQLSSDLEKAYITKLEEALKAGSLVLENGGSAIDAIQKAIIILEDSPLFNAGKGAVFTINGKNELDASIMCGETLKAGAVAGVTNIKNPVVAAHRVMTKTEHVMLIGEGADAFAKVQNLEIVDNSYFFDEKRWQQHLKLKEKSDAHPYKYENESLKFGTVGAVALDKNGNLAAATSTGGMNNKKYGRVGDSPIIGAGTYADNKSCAISATGHGEYFIRHVVAYDIAALMLYKKWTLKKAANFVINDKLKKAKGEGGVIGLDAKGNIIMTFNTNAMFRGYITSEGEIIVQIF